MRGRTITSFAQAFGGFGSIDGSFTPGVQGQPVMLRMQGVPTMPGYRDRVGKWNFQLPERIVELLRPKPVPTGS